MRCVEFDFNHNSTCIFQIESLKVATPDASAVSHKTSPRRSKESLPAARVSRRWYWPQTYLGESSATAQQLALSTVPTYYLVDPEGNLAASSNEWSEIETRSRRSEAFTQAFGLIERPAGPLGRKTPNAFLYQTKYVKTHWPDEPENFDFGIDSTIDVGYIRST